jgi:hypothetical protein
MPEEFVSKFQAIEMVKQATGYGRRSVENAIEKLSAEGKIRIEPDPFDTRRIRIPKSHVQIIIDAMTQ